MADSYVPLDDPTTICPLCMEKIKEGDITDYWNRVLVHAKCAAREAAVSDRGAG